MSVSLIVAMTETGVIGKKNQLPWHLPEDLKHFKRITMGHPILMGRKTFESLGRPLPGRHNVVLTKRSNYVPDGVTVAHSLGEALKLFRDRTGMGQEVFIIGGASLFREALPVADKIYLTLIHHPPFEGDTYFPKVDLEKEFQMVERTGPRSENNISYSFLVGIRK